MCHSSGPWKHSWPSKLPPWIWGGDLQVEHAREAAAVGVGGVVIAGALAVQPHINHLQVVAAGGPGAAALGRLAIDHMADPALTSRQDHPSTELGHLGRLQAQLPLLAELPREPGGSVGAGAGIGKNPVGELLESLQQRRLQALAQDRAGEEIENLHGP
jgi:hypothetical protein